MKKKSNTSQTLRIVFTLFMFSVLIFLNYDTYTNESMSFIKKSFGIIMNTTFLVLCYLVGMRFFVKVLERRIDQ